VAAVTAALAANEKMQIEHCPRCRRVLKIPVAQLRRSLPAGWTPADVPAEQTPEGETVAEAPPVEPAEASDAQPARRSRANGDEGSAPAAKKTTAKKAAAKKSASKRSSTSGKTAAKGTAAKKPARKQSKP
jgi:hypothetical protein